MIRHFSPRVLAVIAIGGIFGALARVAIAEAFGSGSSEQLFATLAVNISGAFAIGVIFPWLNSRKANPLLQPFLITGVLGGFTTFSTFAADVVLTESTIAVTLLYIGVTLVAGLLAVPLGTALFRAVNSS